MARWVKAKEKVRVYKRATEPTTNDGPDIGDLWIDTSVSPPIVQICDDDSPVSFSNIDTGGVGGGAPTDATYIVQTGNGSLSAEQALGDLATGILKSTTTTGVLSIAAAGTDYVAPSTTVTVAGTANQITSSAGAQDLSANRTWTLSLPADVIIPTVITVPNTGLHILDTNASHDLIIVPGSNLTADKTLTITTGDSDRTITLSGDTTLSGTNTGDQSLFRTIAVSGQSDVVADSTTDTLTLVAGSNVTITTDATTDSITIASTGGAGVPTTITVANEATDTTCFPAFFTATTGDLGPKTNASLTFDSSTGALSATTLGGTLTTASQTNITGVGTITTGTWTATDIAVADGGTGASDAATARTNLGAAASATTLTVAGTANQITSSAGAQDLSANRTWTLSLPADVIIPTVITAPNTGLHVLDTDASHDLILKPGSNLTADHTLTITTGDADRTLTIDASATLNGGTHSGTNTGDQSLFSTIAVSGQSNVVADTTSDTLTLVAGTNITITTDAATDAITINASGGGSAAGSDTQVQFNDGGTNFGGDAGLVYNKTTNVLTCDTQITIGGNATAAGKLKLLEDTDDGAHGVTITVPALAADYTLTLPTTDGNADEVLKTDGSGGLSWTTQGSGAPSDAQYVTLATNGTLTNERVLTAGAGITLTDAGAGSTITVKQDFKPNEVIESYEEFIGGTVGTSGTLGENGWSTDVSGTGTAATRHTGLDSTVIAGVVRVETGTTTTGRSAIYFDNNQSIFGVATNGFVIIEALVRVEDLSDGTETYKIWVGFGDSTAGSNHTDGVYFTYSSTDISGNWQGNVAGGGSRTTLNTTTAVVADTWYRLRCEINSAGDSVEFFINGTSKGTIADANIPTATELCFPIFKIVKSAGTTERIAYIDYFYFRKDLTTNRNT